MTVDPLLNAADFRQFRSKSQSWFLGAVGETIRDYCGWHLAPIISETNVEAKIGNMGIIMLPTLNLVSVEELRLNGVALSTDVYGMSDAGYLTYHGFAGRRAYGCTVRVDITHGYEELPKAVAEVGYELTARAMEKPAGILKAMTRGPTQMEFNEFGVVLSLDQKTRLGPYRVTRV